MRKTIEMKGLVLGIILLFIGMSSIPSTAENIGKTPLPVGRGSWLYVGGSGPGNYTRIQDAINNASNGDTIYVYHGIYNEDVEVNRIVSIIGEERNTTIIVGSIALERDEITISKFTIQDGCLDIFFVNHCLVSHCAISSDWDTGIYIRSGSNNTITSCLIYNNSYGLEMYVYSLAPRPTGNNSISSCNFSNNDFGIIYGTPENNTFIHNNFFKNKKHVRFYYYVSGYVDGNYWDNWKGFGRKIIFGFLPLKFIEYGYSLHDLCIVPRFIFDLHPAQEPYDIGG